MVNQDLLHLGVPAAGVTCGTGPLPPGEAATATPTAAPKEGDRTPSPATATAEPTAVARPAASGGDRDDGSLTVVLWSAGVVLAALVAVGLAFLAIRRT